MKLPQLKRWTLHPQPLPRKGTSIVERFGTEFLGESQESRASVLGTVAKEKGTALLQGYDLEVILVTTQDAEAETTDRIQEWLETYRIDLFMEYLPTSVFPLLRFAFAIPSVKDPIFQSETILDITDADFQDFAVHLPTCFELTIFWYSGTDARLIFHKTVGIVGNEFNEQVIQSLKRATRDYWSIPEHLRSFEVARRGLPPR